MLTKLILIAIVLLAGWYGWKQIIKHSSPPEDEPNIYEWEKVIGIDGQG
ncbi:MAG: hypothetical protein WC146_03550 [Patescibacteria group bacterium]